MIRTPVLPRARTHGGVVLAIVFAVVAVDQLAKAWAWRTLGDVHINSGGNPFTGTTVGALLADTHYGAVLDVVNATLLAAALWLVVRFCRSPGLAAAGAALLAGWVSNLGDRLGLHYVTAPGSVRGAVDFIPFAGHYWNLADVVIALGTAGFVVVATGTAARTLTRSRSRDRARVLPPARWPVPLAAFVAVTGFAAVCVFAMIGTVVVGTLDGPGYTF